MIYPSWPVTLSHGPLTLRPFKRADKNAWYQLKESNRDWLYEWEATTPDFSGSLSFSTMRRVLHREAKEGRTLPFVLEFEGKIIGQLTVANIHYGSSYSANIGYWISQEYAGRGLMPLAVAMATDYCFENLRLHRIEIHIRPENAKSIRVVEKLGFRQEGYRKGYLHINGHWADHLSFALCHEEISESLVKHLK